MFSACQITIACVEWAKTSIKKLRTEHGQKSVKNSWTPVVRRAQKEKFQKVRDRVEGTHGIHEASMVWVLNICDSVRSLVTMTNWSCAWLSTVTRIEMKDWCPSSRFTFSDNSCKALEEEYPVSCKGDNRGYGHLWSVGPSLLVYALAT
jgi:hypothetical protein